MTYLSDGAIGRLRDAVDLPDLGGTRYTDPEPIGSGGMGTVYRVRDTALGRDAALKVLRLPEAGSEIAARLRLEANILARLEHPGIVPVHDVGELPDGRVYYVMKLVRGRRLDEYAGDGPSLGERLRVFERVCETVDFAHAHGVIHRDLKPENVMVGAFGEVLVLDWGVAKVVSEREIASGPSGQDSGVTAHGTVLGTPGYMAPEQERGEAAEVDGRADVYALGGLLRFLLGGDRAAALDAVCAKALAHDPSARYQSVEEMRRDVSRFLVGRSVEAYREPFVGRVVRLVRRHRTAVLLVLAYLLLRILLIFFAGA